MAMTMSMSVAREWLVVVAAGIENEDQYSNEDGELEDFQKASEETVGRGCVWSGHSAVDLVGLLLGRCCWQERISFFLAHYFVGEGVKGGRYVGVYGVFTTGESRDERRGRVEGWTGG